VKNGERMYTQKSKPNETKWHAGESTLSLRRFEGFDLGYNQFTYNNITKIFNQLIHQP
jgi:hypothetical protein